MKKFLEDEGLKVWLDIEQTGKVSRRQEFGQWLGIQIWRVNFSIYVSIVEKDIHLRSGVDINNGYSLGPFMYMNF